MSTRSAHDSIGHSRDSAAIPPSPEAHESRVRFRPAKKPGRRARFAVVVAAGANQDIVATGTSLTGCSENDSGDLFAYDAAVPGSGGQGFYYLVRAQGAVPGTYNSTSPKQHHDRDPRIASSSNRCAP